MRRQMCKHLRLSVLLVAFVGAISLCLHASWQPTKAWLSHWLIQYSWQHYMATGKETTPWPWADTHALAKLDFVRANKKIVVLAGGDPTTLAFSAGAVAPFNQPETLQPFVVAGHRDSHFSLLEDVQVDDVITVTDRFGELRTYQVTSLSIIDASEQLLSLENQQSLVLITCYPFNQLALNSNSASNQRLIIEAMRIDEQI